MSCNSPGCEDLAEFGQTQQVKPVKVRSTRERRREFGDCWSFLAVAILEKAVEDFKSQDVVNALDAFLWLLEFGPLYLEGLGLGLDVTTWLARGAGGQSTVSPDTGF